jgi:xylulose-5-phosphate/fructose-6-phosphate phosphoketolase
MDKPDLITVCVVGDGESETGPTATAWHAHKVYMGVVPALKFPASYAFRLSLSILPKVVRSYLSFI